MAPGYPGIGPLVVFLHDSVCPKSKFGDANVNSFKSFELPVKVSALSPMEKRHLSRLKTSPLSLEQQSMPREHPGAEKRSKAEELHFPEQHAQQQTKTFFCKQ